MFSVGMQFNKKLINISAIVVYTGMIFFFFSIFLSDVKVTSQAFIDILNYKNFLDIEYCSIINCGRHYLCLFFNYHY